MEHPGAITDRTAAIDYILHQRCGATQCMERECVRKTLEEQPTKWLLDTANRALDIRVKHSEGRRARRAARAKRE